MNNKDLALAGLSVLTYFYNISVNEAQIKHQFDINGTGLTKTNWLLAAKSLGLKAKAVLKSVERLPFVHLPAMVWHDDGKHFILAQRTKDGRELLTSIFSPSKSQFKQGEFDNLENYAVQAEKMKQEMSIFNDKIEKNSNINSSSIIFDTPTISQDGTK